MENVIAERVKSARLTRAQQKIAEYFVRNPERVGRSSSMEVARAIGVSDASITRFARAIGYDGFTELKADLYSHMVDQATGGVNSLSLAERFERNRAAHGGGPSREEFLKVLEYNLAKTMQQNDEEKFDQAVELLLAARHRYVVGLRGCLGVAGQCAWLLRFLVDHVTAVGDEGPGGIGCLQDAEAGDFVLLFSVARYYKSDVRLARLAKSRGARLCVVADSVLSPLADLADVLLLAETKHMSFFNSTIALNTVYEYLVTKTAQRRLDAYRERAEERDALTVELRL